MIHRAGYLATISCMPIANGGSFDYAIKNSSVVHYYKWVICVGIHLILGWAKDPWWNLFSLLIEPLYLRSDE